MPAATSSCGTSVPTMLLMPTMRRFASRTSKRLGVLGHSEALKGFVSRDSEVAAPVANSRPEPNAEAASSRLSRNRSSEEHTASGGGKNRCQFLGGRPALHGHGEAQLVVHALPLADRNLGRLKGLEALSAPELLGVNAVTALDLAVLLGRRG